MSYGYCPLAVEPLEGRDCPSPAVTWHGGEVIPPGWRLQPVLYGAAWATDPVLGQQAGWVQSALADLVSSPYMDMLSVYGTGRGVCLPGVVVNGPLSAPGVLDNGLIEQQFHTFRADPNTLYLLLLPPGVVSTFGPSSSAADYEGYHWSTGDRERFAVIPYPGGPNVYSAAAYPTPLNQITVAASHEIAEWATDPEVGIGYVQAPSGQLVPVVVQTGWHDAGGREVGDLALAYRFVYHGGYWVQSAAGPDGLPLFPAD